MQHCVWCSWGEVDQRPNFSTATAVHPVGYRATWPNKHTGAVFVSRVIAAGDAPRYTVSMQSSADAPERVSTPACTVPDTSCAPLQGFELASASTHAAAVRVAVSVETDPVWRVHKQVIAEGSSADEAWSRAADRQKKCIAAKLAHEKALLPPAKKRSPKAKPDPAGTTGTTDAAPSVKAETPDAAQGAAPTMPRKNGAAASGATQDTAIQLASPAAAAAPTPGAVAPAGAAAEVQGNGLAAVSTPPPADRRSPSVAAAADGKKSPEKADSKLKVVFKRGGAKGSTPGKGSPAKAGSDGHVPKLPPQLTKAERRLIDADSLAGAWGAERFGFADTTVLHVRHRRDRPSCIDVSGSFQSRPVACCSRGVGHAWWLACFRLLRGGVCGWLACLSGGSVGMQHRDAVCGE